MERSETKGKILKIANLLSGFALMWERPDETSFQATFCLGDVSSDEAHRIAEAAVKNGTADWKHGTLDEGTRLFWPSSGSATTALLIANHALTAADAFTSAAESYEKAPKKWMRKALKAGWTPPKETPKC
jgi:hypothetical protein